MIHIKRQPLFSCIVLVVLLFQLINPPPARADEAPMPTPEVSEAVTVAPMPATDVVLSPATTESAPETATEVTPVVLPTQAVQVTEALPATEAVLLTATTESTSETVTEITPVVLPTNTPVPTQAPTENAAPAEPPAEAADEPNKKETPQAVLEIPPTETPAPETETPIPTATEAAPADLPALLEQAPAGTDVVVVGADGQPEPLASVAAAEALVSGDPIWCPTGQAPTPGANGCTDNYTTMNELLAAIAIGAGGPPYEPISPAQNGTIWITSGAVGDVSVVTINGLTYPSWANYALTLQGGWSGISGDTTIGANSVFTVPIQIDGWNNNISLNNITVDSGTGSRINFIDGDVNINNSQLVNATIGGEETGLYVVTRNGGDVFINNSQFNNNNAGLDVNSSGNISITASTFSNNTAGGLVFNYNANAYIRNSFITNNNNPYGSGTGILYYGDSGLTPSAIDFNLTLDCVTLAGNDNNFDGADYSAGSITINPTEILCASSPTPATPTPATPTPVVMSPISIYRLAPGQKEFTFDLVCKTADQRYWVIAASGDLIEIHCMVSGKAKLRLLDNTELPGDLPAGYDYVASYMVEILQAGVSIPVITSGGYIRSSFVAQQSDSMYKILFWDADAKQWSPFKDFQVDASGMPVVFPFDPSDPNDLRKILSGANYLEQLEPNRMDVSMNFTGLFVLVKH